uniref:Uncharacterized protein n=1 Tax=Leersia perrieri TaxID=77586 RepID=A0A0D9VYD6_9ORYZ
METTAAVAAVAWPILYAGFKAFFTPGSHFFGPKQSGQAIGYFGPKQAEYGTKATGLRNTR